VIGKDPSILAFLFALSLLLGSACTAAPQPTETPTSEATLPVIPPATEIIVESVGIRILESFPVQVEAPVRGQLPDACSLIENFTQELDEQTFRIELTIARRLDARCTPALTPFEQVVPLDISGLPAGSYIVEVHGVQASFDLAVDNFPPSVDEPGGWIFADLRRPDPCNNWLFGIAMLSEEEGWAVGEMGIILHWDGEAWREFPGIPLPTGSLLDLEMLSREQGWSVGGATSLGEFSTICAIRREDNRKNTKEPLRDLCKLRELHGKNRNRRDTNG
jgi:inhibitor of cysteine peptidase